METRGRVLNFTEEGKINEIYGEKQCIRDRGKIFVVVSATETRPSASSEYLERKKVNDEISFLDVTSSVHSFRDENGDDDKENAEEKRILDESKVSRGNREADKIFPQQQQRQQVNRSPRRKSAGIPTLLCIDGGGLADATTVGVKRKIPRPANAFMLFANEWRRKLAAENPRDSNKDISVRLGIFWKNMSKDVKEKYFALAREVDREHKRKYPVGGGGRVPSGQLRSPGSGETTSMRPAPSDIDGRVDRIHVHLRACETRRTITRGWPAKGEKAAGV